MKNTLIASALMSFLLTACGGGGGESDSGEAPTPDTTAPVINLVGSSTVTVEAGSSYTDEGATANDNKDGNITVQIAVSNPVDTKTLGSYTVTYNVSDKAGNAANQITRDVNVVDTTAPVITILGELEVTVKVGDEYIDAGATSLDSFEGSLTPMASSTVDINTVGSYTVTYIVSDSSGNAANSVTRRVYVEDTVDSSLLPPQVPSL